MSAKLIVEKLLEDASEEENKEAGCEFFAADFLDDYSKIRRLEWKLTLKEGWEFVLKSERILTNDVTLPDDRWNYHNVRLWVVWNEYGALGAVWASNEQDALDELVDNDLGNSFLISAEDYAAMTEEEQERCAHLGNAGEPANLDNAGMDYAVLKDQEPDFLFALKVARDQNLSNLGELTPKNNE